MQAIAIAAAGIAAASARFEASARRTAADPLAGLTAETLERIGAESFVVRVAEGAVTAARTEPVGAEAVVTGSPEAVAAVVYGDPAEAAARMAELLAVEGDAAAFLRFTRWFELPPKAERRAV